MNTLFCDLDGVLVNFEAGFYDNFNVPHSSVPEDEAWDMIENHHMHWDNLPPMDDWNMLWSYIKKYKPIILTGCPRIGHDIAAAGKREWVKKHLGSDVPVITCFSKDKQLHMKNKGDVLIDDLVKNIKRWKEAGGNGLLHVDSLSTIGKLKELGW
ncbi:5'-3' deoxyribonucleotidase [Agrobacterium phage Atu_ph07]|uniref:Uncharacterized protein n=1 Tax=Agrobacterium phage Atu_ph07 TaxID=2024264 RepID=A0A223W0M6_9CAUD|nr:5'-3' deoxyribonucleotidase [Agrobacterium phage Atu_ph07]ASV44737.1 hypothetical protein [Agrobacterium phage Atu_ph07]